MVHSLNMGKQIVLKSVPRVSVRWILFGSWIAVSVLLFLRPIAGLVHYALHNDNASHVLIIPFLAAAVLYRERKTVFQQVSNDLPLACCFLILSLIFSSWTLHSAARWSPALCLTGYTLALVLFWIAGFALLFGRSAMAAGRFSLLFLLLTVPLSDSALNGVIYWLQKGSADVSEFFFDLTGVPVLRDGFFFHLPRLSIEVARECSGIRSSMALFILALLAGHFYLGSFWKQVVFQVCGFFLMIVKNGVRIVTLTLLANYVDPGFLFGNLHRDGGVVFFLLGLVLLLPVLGLLRRGKHTHGIAVDLPTAEEG
jgi:exosortase